MENELETIQQIYNVVVEFIINYSFQILGAIIILVIGAKLAGWLGRLRGRARSGRSEPCNSKKNITAKRG